MRFHGPSIIEEMVACSLRRRTNQRGVFAHVVVGGLFGGQGSGLRSKRKSLDWRPSLMGNEGQSPGECTGGHEGWYRAALAPFDSCVWLRWLLMMKTAMV